MAELQPALGMKGYIGAAPLDGSFRPQGPRSRPNMETRMLRSTPFAFIIATKASFWRWWPSAMNMALSRSSASWLQM